jgi:flagellar basal body rod protein FlgC
MGVFDGLDISGSGLTAHRKWMETAAMNIANANEQTPKHTAPIDDDDDYVDPASDRGMYLAQDLAAIGEGPEDE